MKVTTLNGRHASNYCLISNLWSWIHNALCVLPFLDAMLKKMNTNIYWKLLSLLFSLLYIMEINDSRRVISWGKVVIKIWGIRGQFTSRCCSGSSGNCRSLGGKPYGCTEPSFWDICWTWIGSASTCSPYNNSTSCHTRSSAKFKEIFEFSTQIKMKNF